MGPMLTQDQLDQAMTGQGARQRLSPPAFGLGQPTRWTRARPTLN